MQLTRTINSDKRYYLDEDEIQNVESLIQTMERFNHIKIKLYNCLYDKSFLKRGPLLEETYSSWLKRNYGTTDYYNCAIYTYASSVLSSQKELNRLYQRTKEKDIETRNQKIKRTQEELEKKQGTNLLCELILKAESGSVLIQSVELQWNETKFFFQMEHTFQPKNTKEK